MSSRIAHTTETWSQTRVAYAGWERNRPSTLSHESDEKHIAGAMGKQYRPVTLTPWHRGCDGSCGWLWQVGSRARRLSYSHTFSLPCCPTLLAARRDRTPDAPCDCNCIGALREPAASACARRRLCRGASLCLCPLTNLQIPPPRSAQKKESPQAFSDEARPAIVCRRDPGLPWKDRGQAQALRNQMIELLPDPGVSDLLTHPCYKRTHLCPQSNGNLTQMMAESSEPSALQRCSDEPILKFMGGVLKMAAHPFRSCPLIVGDATSV